ncbi:hypothetical protein DL765_008049 [Monosporascus sp. GIB2]|nr:hypothetical protein DL765_008049 [Monosporascus sp. GIB2]
MDPSSLAASAITVASLAVSTCSAISELRSLCQGLPGRLHAVSNEVADLELVLTEVAALLRERAALLGSPRSLGAIPHLLIQAKTKLKELDAVLDRLTAASVNYKAPLLESFARQDLTRIRLDIQEVSAITVRSVKQPTQEQLAVGDIFMYAMANIDERVARVEEVIHAQSDQLPARHLSQVGPSYRVPAPSGKRILTRKHKESAIPSRAGDSIGLLVQPCAQAGNISGLQYLFRHGLAPPRDVSSSRGYTLLRWSLYAKQYEAVEFLVHAGADPDYRPVAALDNSPRIKACHFLLKGGLSEKAINAIRTITKGGDYLDFIDGSKFTKTHKIVLGLSLQNLEEELLLNPDDINLQDTMGRTPLAWAAARGNTQAVATLLSHGADPTIMDIQISGPLSNAAAQGHTTCVELLLEAQADPDPPLPEGETPLTTAIECNSHNTLRLYLDRWSEYTVCSRLKGPNHLEVAALYGDCETLAILASADHLRSKPDQHYALADF